MSCNTHHPQRQAGAALVTSLLLLVVLAASILAGRYTGYRLLEFWRFRSVIRGPEEPS